jgi:hypothetical protein
VCDNHTPNQLHPAKCIGEQGCQDEPSNENESSQQVVLWQRGSPPLRNLFKKLRNVEIEEGLKNIARLTVAAEQQALSETNARGVVLKSLFVW